MATVSVRYIVDSVDGAIAFYTQHLGFSVDAYPAPAFAILSLDDLRLLLNAPSGPGGAVGTLEVALAPRRRRTHRPHIVPERNAPRALDSAPRWARSRRSRWRRGRDTNAGVAFGA
jgi:catechol 2,3-dioxygenase-like lactoylglutathione lyase family enzyme